MRCCCSLLQRERAIEHPPFYAFIVENPSIRFLFVNDGSTDGTRELLDELSAGTTST